MQARLNRKTAWGSSDKINNYILEFLQTLMYRPSLANVRSSMIRDLYRTATFALYQSSLMLGIVMLPFALLARRVGISVPMHRFIARMKRAYERASTDGTR